MAQNPEQVVLPEQMTEPADAVAGLLERWPFESLLAANLDALESVQPSLARQVRQAGETLPAGVTPAVALDGSVTFRVPYDVFASDWLGHCSTPWYAALSSVERIEASGGNLALPGVGNGFLARLILERKIQPMQALFVIDSDSTGPRDLNLALRLHDWAPAIRSGRLVLLCHADPVAALTAYYHDRPGYQLITTVALNPTWSRKDNAAFNKRVTEAMQAVASQQCQAVERLSEQWRRALTGSDWPDPGQLHAANLPTGFSRDDYYQSRDLLAGLEALGARVRWLDTQRPDEVALSSQLARLTDPPCHLVVLVNAFRGDRAAAVPAEARCLTVWTRPPDELPEPLATQVGPQDAVVCYRADTLAELRQRGLPDERTEQILPLVDPALFCPGPVDPDERLCSDIALVSDRYSTDPACYRIQLPSHQQLWRQVIAEIEKAPGGYHTGTAQRYLNRAQACGVDLQNKELREHFCQLIRQYLGRSVLKDTYARSLLERGYQLKIWDWAEPAEGMASRMGSTWSQSPACQAVAGVVAFGEPLNRLYRSVKIVLEIEPTGAPTAGLLSAIAAGAFVLVRANPDMDSAGQIGRLFRVNDELVVFDSPQDLARKVRYYLDHPDKRQAVADRARRKLLEAYTAAHMARRCLRLVQ